MQLAYLKLVNISYVAKFCQDKLIILEYLNNYVVHILQKSNCSADMDILPYKTLQFRNKSCPQPGFKIDPKSAKIMSSTYGSIPDFCRFVTPKPTSQIPEI